MIVRRARLGVVFEEPIGAIGTGEKVTMASRIILLAGRFLTVLLLLLGLGAVRAAAQVVPCGDPNGCPDLTVDASKLAQWKIDRATFSSSDCAVIEGEVSAGRRILLRFSFGSPNIGAGDLVVGNPSDHPDWFDFNTCHGHPHFKQYADYRLWTVDGYNEWSGLRRDNPGALSSDLLAQIANLGSKMISGRKFGFCTIDVYQYSGTAGPAKYDSCLTNQGISVGWGDLYGYQLDGQWIDVTDIPGGTYILEGEVNAEHFFTEMDYTNNSATTVVKIPGGRGHR